MKTPEEIENEIADQAEHLIDVSTQHHSDWKSGEVFIECYVCGKFDEHNEECFIPYIQKWLDKPK